MAAALSTSLANRAYIVTGGFSGIGLATVRKLLQHSATVHVVDSVDSPPSYLTRADSATTNSSGEVHFFPSVDVSSRNTVQNAFKSILQRSPNISGLVSSAGISPSSAGSLKMTTPFTKPSPSTSPGSGTHRTIHLDTRVRGNCSIVNIDSSASYAGFKTLGAYTASKHAVLGLTRTWTLNFASHGIRVNLVAPGGTRTPFSAAQFNDAERGDMSREVYPLIPMKRFAEPKELADTIVYSLGDESLYITGQMLKVNGGWP